MAEINNTKDLERWFSARRRKEAILIASRTALRVFPLLAGDVQENAEARGRAVLAVLRALNPPWAAAAGIGERSKLTRVATAAYIGLLDVDLRSAVANAAASAAYSTVPQNDQNRHAISAVTSAAAAAANAADYSSADFSSDFYTDAVAVAEFWAAVTQDATELEAGEPVDALAQRQLWPGEMPAWVNREWAKLWGALLSDDQSWEVWTQWYEGRLLGARFEKEIEEARVLIRDDVWREGPAAVNASIAQFVEARGERAEGNPTAEAKRPVNVATGSGKTDSVARIAHVASELREALGSMELKVALTDFTHNPVTNTIDLAPFGEDLPQLRAPALRVDHEDKLAALAAACASFAADLRDDAPNVPRAIARDLERYAEQAERGPGHANPRLLYLYGAALKRAQGDSETMLGLGSYLGGKLADIVGAHEELKLGYPASVQARLESAADLPLAPDATSEAIAAELNLIATRLPTAEWGDLPAPSVDLPDLLHEQAELLREIERQIDRTEDARSRATLERMRQQTKVSALSTVGRFGVFAASIAAVSLSPGAVLGGTAAAFTIAQAIDWLCPDTLAPHLRRVADWLFLRDPGRASDNMPEGRE